MTIKYRFIDAKYYLFVKLKINIKIKCKIPYA